MRLKGLRDMRLNDLRETAPWRAGASAALAFSALLTIAGCASSPIPTEVPTAQSIAGLAPSGTVKLTEAFVGGAGIGKGVLTYKGKNYPFRLIGSVIGPGSVSKLDVSGDIYKLDDISQFPGAYAQGNGQIGLETSGASDLWLENKAGVVMHLTGAQTGLTLSLGRDEVIIEMAK